MTAHAFDVAGRVRSTIAMVEDQPARVAADMLLASLATVPTLTDIPTTLFHAERLAKRVRYLANKPALAGMLGENGIAPAVRACVLSAQRVGFDWRAYPAGVDTRTEREIHHMHREAA